MDLEIRLASAYQMLTEARDDFERLQVRDFGKAIQEAAGILKHKAIQVQASLLVADAERAIAKANPPMSRQESGAQKGNKVVIPEDNLISQSNLRNIRQAHSKHQRR